MALVEKFDALATHLAALAAESVRGSIQENLCASRVRRELKSDITKDEETSRPQRLRITVTETALWILRPENNCTSRRGAVECSTSRVLEQQKCSRNFFNTVVSFIC